MNPLLWIVLTGFFVILLVLSEARRYGPGIWVAKPLASLGFIGTAVASGAADSKFGCYVLAALVLSFIGDVLLIPKSQLSFKAGIGSFLLGHVLFAVSFGVFGASLPYVIGGVVIVVPLSAVVARWILPHVPAELKIPVIAYVVVISAMVALATGTLPTDMRHLLFPAAVAFFLSDLSVARDRFVQPGFVNRLWGLPLYYAAQLVFAVAAGSP